MEPPVALLATFIIGYAAVLIAQNSIRIQKKFHLDEAVRLDDLTQATIFRTSGKGKEDQDVPAVQSLRSMPVSSSNANAATNGLGYYSSASYKDIV